MKTGIDMAKCYLHCCGYSLVVVKQDCVEIISRERGILPLLMIYDKCTSQLEGAVLADKVVGKAAAFIIVETRIREVYADVMSEPAAAILAGRGIRCSYGSLVPRITNPDGSGDCPIDKLCRDIDDPLDGIMAITAYLCNNKFYTEGYGAVGNENCKWT